MAQPTQKYLIEYSNEPEPRVRVSNEEYETEWMDRPEDGQVVVTVGEGEEEEVLLVTLDNYEGPLEPDTCYLIGDGEETEVMEDVDPEEDGESADDDDGSGDSDGEGDGDGDEDYNGQATDDTGEDS